MPEVSKVRLDKWLWAARFFKTRSLAKKAIEGGKVHHAGPRVKVSKEVTVGDTLAIRQGWDEKTVRILALSEQRRGAPEAALLYEETPESLAKRELAAAQRQANRQLMLDSGGRPDKRQRRQLARFNQQRLDQLLGDD